MSTRVEVLTPPGPGGIAVVALRGPAAASRLAELVARDLPPVGGLGLARLVHAGEVLDEALLVRRGEQHFELGLHGGPGLVAEVLQALGGASRPPASVEALAARALEDAPCERAARVLLDQAEGALRRAVQAARGAPAEPERWRAAWQAHARLLVPAVVVLAGPVNAGKSTLFNLLVGEERVTVSGEPGTTRDAIAARARVGQHAIELVDTAGARPLPGAPVGSAAAVESAGQALARDLRARADVVLWLAPPGEGRADRAAPALTTQADRLGDDPAGWPPDALSALRAPEHARARVEALLAGVLALPRGDPWTPGAPVPPSAAFADDLERAFARPPGPARDAALDDLLGAADALLLP